MLLEPAWNRYKLASSLPFSEVNTKSNQMAVKLSYHTYLWAKNYNMSSQLITSFKNEVTQTFIINSLVISFNFRPKNEPLYRDLFAHKVFHHNISHDYQKKAKYNVWQSNSIGCPKLNVFSNINIRPGSIRQFARAGAGTVTLIKLQVVIIRAHDNRLYLSAPGLFLNDS